MSLSSARYEAFVQIGDPEHDGETVPVDDGIVEAFTSAAGQPILPETAAIGPIRFSIAQVVPGHGRTPPAIDGFELQGTWLRFVTKVDARERNLAGEYGPIGREPLEGDDLHDDAIERMTEALGFLLFCATIALPGRFEVGLVRIPGQSPAFAGEPPHLRSQRLLPLSLQPEWPVLRTLDVLAVHRWISGIDGWPEGAATSRVGRALAALTHLWSIDAFTPLGLVWSMAGLEALFCDEAGDPKQQLLMNAPILLGPLAAARDLIDAMYRERSRFLRGAMPMPFMNRETVDWDEADSVYGQPMDGASTMLLACIQELAARQWTDWELGGATH